MMRALRGLLERSVTRRLVVALLLAYVLTWGAMVVISDFSLSAVGSGEFDKEMEGVGGVVAQALEDPARPAEAVLRGLALKIVADGARVGAEGGFEAFHVHDAAGRLLVEGGRPLPALSDDGRNGFFQVGEGSARLHVYRRWAADGTRRIDVVQSAGTRAAMLRYGLSSPVTVAQLLIGFPMLLLPTWLAVRTGLRPLLRLSRELAGRPPGDLRPMKEDQPYRELRPVVRELNETLARLQALLQRERAFLADAAHELRTPLAVIAAQCDTLKQSADAAACALAAQRLERGLARAMRLVNQLLALARLEADVEHRREPVDVADVVRDCLAMHADAAQARDIELAYAGPDRLPMVSVEHALESVLHNLIGNAIRYGRPGGQVEVRLRQQDDGVCVLDVADDGPGIALEDRARMFERFRRGESSGSLTGTGLGLAIVQAAARQLDARIEVAGGLGGTGLRVSLHWEATPRLPRA